MNNDELNENDVRNGLEVDKFKVENPNQSQIEGLRELAQWFEEHPELHKISLNISEFNYVSKRELSIPIVRTLAKALGAFEKKYDDNYVILRKEFNGGFGMTFYFQRDAICEKVKEFKEVDTWKCEPLLGLEDIPVSEE